MKKPAVAISCSSNEDRRGNDPCHQRRKSLVRRLRLRGAACRQFPNRKRKKACHRLQKAIKKRRKRQRAKTGRSAARADLNRRNPRNRRRVDPNLQAERERNLRRRSAPDLALRTRKRERTQTAKKDRDPGKSGVTGTIAAGMLIAADSVLVMVPDVGPRLKEVAALPPPIAVGAVLEDLLLREENDPRKGKRNPEALRQQDPQSLLQRNAICAPSYACSCLRRCASVICASSCLR